MTDPDGADQLRLGDDLVPSEAARSWIDERASRFGQHIDGEWRSSASGELLSLAEPATARPLWELTPAADADADAAAEAARRASEAWRRIVPGERAACLRSVAAAIESGAAELAALEALGSGRPIRHARERIVPLAASHFAYCANQLESLAGSGGEHEPRGVVAVIVTSATVARTVETVARALAAGNSVIVAAGPGAALGALRLAEACQEAGLPAGVLNVVTGDLSSQIAVARQPGVGAVAFAGTRDAGAQVRRAIAGRDLLVAANTGSRSLVLVFDDADLDSAAAATLNEMARFDDPPRLGATRLLLHEAIAESFCDQLRWRMDRLSVRDPLDPSTDVGPVDAPAVMSDLEELRRLARSDGASVHVASCGTPDQGWFFAPTLVFDAPPAARAAQDEAAGPVLVATTFRSPAEAVALASSGCDGSQVGLWTEDVTAALTSARDLATGSVSVNGSAPVDPGFGTSPIRGAGYGAVGGRSGYYTFGRPRRQRGAAAAQAQTLAKASERAPDGPPDPDAVRDIGHAVERALSAGTWSRLPGGGRAVILSAAAALCDPEGEADLERVMRAYAAWAAQANGSLGIAADGGMLATTREPVGVVGVAIAGDDPGEARGASRGISQLVVAALAVGNRVVVGCQSSDQSPVEELGRVLGQAGAPDGAVIVAFGPPRELASALADHAGVDMLWLVGTPHLSEEVESRCSEAGKRLCLFREAGRPPGSLDDGALESVVADGELLRLSSYEKSVWVALEP